jgi:hypothetical protein
MMHCHAGISHIWKDEASQQTQKNEQDACDDEIPSIRTFIHELAPYEGGWTRC